MSLFDTIAYHISPSLPPTLVKQLDLILQANGGRRAEGVRDPALNLVISDSLRFDGWEEVAARRAAAGATSEGNENRTVDVVTPTFVERSVVIGKLQSPQHYSADPSLFFSGVVACGADLPSSDLEVLSGGITGLGGQWRSALTSECTHLFAVSPDSAKYQTAMHYQKDTGIKVVLPHWFDDCVRLGVKGLSEEMYEWPECRVLKGPEGLLPPPKERGTAARSTPESKRRNAADKEIDNEREKMKRNLFLTAARFTPSMNRSSPPADADLTLVAPPPPSLIQDLNMSARSTSHRSPLPTRPNALTAEPQAVWEGRKILLSRTLQLYAQRREAVQAGIERAGGQVLRFDGDDEEQGADDSVGGNTGVGGAGAGAGREQGQGQGWNEKLGRKERRRRRREAERVSECDVYVTRWRYGRAYIQAVREHKMIGTLAWLFHVQACGIITHPINQLLHYPVPKRPIEAFSKHVITVTNYTGEAREYLKKLVSAMGAEFTPSMSGGNTVLVAAYTSGTKAQKALAWSIPVVNHLWLEDCFISWRNLTVANEKYIVFRPGDDFSKRLGERGVAVGVANGISGAYGSARVSSEQGTVEDGEDTELGRIEQEAEELADEMAGAGAEAGAGAGHDDDLGNSEDDAAEEASEELQRLRLLELAREKERERGLQMDMIVMPGGTGGTEASMKEVMDDLVVPEGGVDFAVDVGVDVGAGFGDEEMGIEGGMTSTPKKGGGGRHRANGRVISPVKPTFQPSPSAPRLVPTTKTKVVEEKDQGRKKKKRTVVVSSEEEEDDEGVDEEEGGVDKADADEDEDEEPPRKSSTKPTKLVPVVVLTKGSTPKSKAQKTKGKVKPSRHSPSPSESESEGEEDAEEEEDRSPSPVPPPKKTKTKAKTSTKSKRREPTPPSSEDEIDDEDEMDVDRPPRPKPKPSKQNGVDKTKSKSKDAQKAPRRRSPSPMPVAAEDEEEESTPPPPAATKAKTKTKMRPKANAISKASAGAGRGVVDAEEDDNDDETQIVPAKGKAKAKAQTTQAQGLPAGGAAGLLGKVKGDARTRIKRRSKDKPKPVVESEDEDEEEEERGDDVAEEDEDEEVVPVRKSQAKSKSKQKGVEKERDVKGKKKKGNTQADEDDEDEVEVLVTGSKSKAKSVSKTKTKTKTTGKKKVAESSDEDEEEKKVEPPPKKRTRNPPSPPPVKSRSKPLRVYSTAEEDVDDEDEEDEIPAAASDGSDSDLPENPVLSTRSQNPTNGNGNGKEKEKENKAFPASKSKNAKSTKATDGKAKAKGKKAPPPTDTETETEDDEQPVKSTPRKPNANANGKTKTTAASSTGIKRVVSVLMPSLQLSPSKASIGKQPSGNKSKGKKRAAPSSGEDEDEDPKPTAKSKKAAAKTQTKAVPTSKNSKAKAKPPPEDVESEDENESEEENEVSVLVSPRAARALGRTESIRAVAGQTPTAGANVSPTKATSISAAIRASKKADTNATASSSKAKATSAAQKAKSTNLPREESMDVDADNASTSTAPHALARPSRSAAAKATQRLHETIMPDLLQYEAQKKKSKRMSSSNSAAFTLEDEERVSGSQTSGVEKRKQADDGDDGKAAKKRRVSNVVVEDENDDDAPPPKTTAKGKGKAKAGPAAADDAMDVDDPKSSGSGIMVMTTQVTLSEEVIKALGKLGVKMTSRPTECTHLLAPHVVRTEKFLCALASRAPWILQEKWATESARAKRILPEKDFILKDKAGESKYGVTLAESLTRAKELMDKGRLLHGHTFYLTPKVPVDTKLLKNVVVACGGAISTQTPTLRIINAAPATRHVVSCKEDIAIWRPIASSRTIKIYTQELILTGILNQKMDWDNQEFYLPGS